MAKRFRPIDLSGLLTYPLSERKSKVDLAHFSTVWEKGEPFSRFLSSLPDILAGADLRGIIDSIVAAAGRKKTVLLGMGAHVTKVGLNPILIDLMERGIVTAVAMNGAGIIHDLELALSGKTSEDVDASLKDGSFGMAHETAELLCDAVRKAGDRSTGLGEAVGAAIIEESLPHSEISILAAGVRLGVPVTVHVAFGTDILHMHPGFDPESAGGATHRDFRTLASVVAALDGGVYLNVGSAVVLPEVFLKALTLVRNLGHPLENFTTVNLDFIQHYRPMTNVVRRPSGLGGRGFHLTGHHEIMIPLIAAGVIEAVGS